MADSNTTNLYLFFGHFHPLLVHLPIGGLTVLALLEVAARTRRLAGAAAARGLVLALTVGTALASVLLGLLLSTSGDYDPQLLFWHQWLGITLAAVCLLAALAYGTGRPRLYTALLALALAILAPAGHLGGSMTHGSDYLTQYAPPWVHKMLGQAPPSTGPAPKVTDPLEAAAFADLIHPMLQQNCGGCHSAAKHKGNLQVDTWHDLTKAREGGPALVTGNAAESLLVRRLLLPSTNSKHMPPAGKPQPSAEQITLLQWWIDAGASPDKKVAQLDPPAKVLRALATIYGSAAAPVPPLPLAQLQPVIDRLTQELGVVIVPCGADQPWLAVNAGVARTFGDRELARLAPLGVNVQTLNLAGTKVTDGGLAVLATMPNLTRLQLENTAITDAGLRPIARLYQLDYLNLYGTAITDAGLGRLKSLPNLRHLYLWHTQVTPAATQAFGAAMIDHQSIERWQQEIQTLQARIAQQALDVVQGTATVINPTTPPAVPPAVPATTAPKKP